MSLQYDAWAARVRKLGFASYGVADDTTVTIIPTSYWRSLFESGLSPEDAWLRSLNQAPDDGRARTVGPRRPDAAEMKTVDAWTDGHYGDGDR